MSATAPLVEVQDLNVRFVTRESTVRAVNGVSFAMAPGEVLCMLGESGSGKSVTMRALMRLLPPKRAVIDGKVRIAGQDVLAMGDGDLRRFRGGTVSMIFQEPMTAFDPVARVGDQIAEVVALHKGVSHRQGLARALELFDLVKIPSAQRRLDAYPFELSGGLRQRAMIAMALSCEPKLLLADEPTTALDATVQIQVLILLRRLQQEMGMSVIFVTHDLGVAAEIADRVAVMYAGRVVETGPVREVLRDPMHPYTAGLLASTVHNQPRDRDLETIPGAPPDLRNLPPGCKFAPRCSLATSECLAGEPSARHPAPGRMARCVRVPDAALTPEFA
ncbi:ABC transporter ATP-binding protein [Roseomonas gilardii]|uniref:ABC transporter ATP-binding protein n=1 Tax=Roseomonas gilardii TaxID=257708 RepID=A0A1L7AIP2_9PROT|nr:ABC transporter ATP-binding protein [Roseomonas gilardii]APT58570.1 dipeptide ABC transporter ATP-binding protein DppD [Roseomonas gilardii]MDT8333620.1 ABC transporter ATP-binding protein [Roseomonas gilardii]SUE42539.1 Glutathione import ATP-binding protein GsiA [Roseomonas gilardii subsp. rosea]